MQSQRLALALAVVTAAAAATAAPGCVQVPLQQAVLSTSSGVASGDFTNPRQEYGTLRIAVRWPNELQRKSLRIPDASTKVKVTITKTAFSREEFITKVGGNWTGNYTLAAGVYNVALEAELADGTALAGGATGVTIYSGAIASYTSTLDAAYKPMINDIRYAGVTTNVAKAGDTIRLIGTNLSKTWELAKPIVEFGGVAANPDDVTIVDGTTLDVVVRAGNVSGLVTVKADGVPYRDGTSPTTWTENRFWIVSDVNLDLPARTVFGKSELLDSKFLAYGMSLTAQGHVSFAMGAGKTFTNLEIGSPPQVSLTESGAGTIVEGTTTENAGGTTTTRTATFTAPNAWASGETIKAKLGTSENELPVEAVGITSVTLDQESATINARTDLTGLEGVTEDTSTTQRLFTATVAHTIFKMDATIIPTITWSVAGIGTPTKLTLATGAADSDNGTGTATSVRTVSTAYGAAAAVDGVLTVKAGNTEYERTDTAAITVTEDGKVSVGVN